MHSQFRGDFFADLPLVLAGPVLQRVTSEAVSVWVAVQRPCQVQLTVSSTTQAGHQIGAPLMAGHQATMAFGTYLHVVVVTARLLRAEPLVSDRIYAYDLAFTLDDAESSPLSLQAALCSHQFPRVEISYFAHQQPTFVLPATHLDDLRMVHGSCRKPHGDGFDALPILDCLIEAAASEPQCRPQQLFMTGDQIYGDDVAAPLLWVATHVGEALLGWEERLPVGPREPDDVVYYTPTELLPGERAEVATAQAGFTAGLQGKQQKVTSHLLSLGEYYASYLLAWSPVCWPKIPPGQAIMRDRTAIRQWEQEARDMRQFVHTLWKVRRALANIPAYSIFDDHDVSDDWNLNQAWCLRVLGRPLGRRVVQNALLAYALFQGWGNTPWQFEAAQPGAKLLQAAQAWSASQGTDAAAWAAIARYVGLPPSDPLTRLPTFVPDDLDPSVMRLARDPDALTWHFSVTGPCHEVMVLDTRNWRGYPADDKPIAPPMLLSPQAFDQQLIQPLQRQPDAPQRLTFVVAPTNVFGLKVIDWIHHWKLNQKQVFSTDVGDAWNIHSAALAQFLTTLFNQRQHVVVLSGDIHYSSVVRLSHTTLEPATLSVLVQLTCSAIKNEELLTRLLHTRLKDWLLPERVRRWQGWSQPPDMVELTARSQTCDRTTPPDWLCALEWIPRQRSETASFGTDIPWLLPPWKRARQARWRWLRPLMAWKYRWFQDGREVVGLNNLALISFEQPDSERPPVVNQDLYWFSPWVPTQLVYSHFSSSLSPNPTLLPAQPGKAVYQD